MRETIHGSAVGGNLWCGKIAKRFKENVKRALRSGNKNVNPGVEVQRPIREAWRRV